MNNDATLRSLSEGKAHGFRQLPTVARESADAQTQAFAHLHLARLPRDRQPMTDGEAAPRRAGPTRLLQTALTELSELLRTQKRHEEAMPLLHESL